MKKSEIDWMRSIHNLEPRPMDWQDKLVIGGSLVVGVICILLLLEGWL